MSFSSSRVARRVVRPSAALLAVVASTWLVGCGAASKEPASSYSAPEPRTMDEAEAQLAAAERDLGGGAPAGTSAGGSAATPPSAAPPASAGATEAPTTKAPREDVHAESDEMSSDSAPSPCQTPCRAIASMRNAVRAICRLAGDADPRCTEAKGRLSASEARVSSCGC